jgi:hypothetical protein
MPRGSLLAQSELQQQKNRRRLSAANALGTGADGPLLDIRGRKEGDPFDRGMLGRREREKEARIEAVRQSSYGSGMGIGVDPMALQMQGVSVHGGAMGMMGGGSAGGMMGVGANPMMMGMVGMMPGMNMSMPMLPHQQQQQQMMGMGGMMNPMLQQHYPPQQPYGMVPPHMQMPGAMGGMPMGMMSSPNLMQHSQLPVQQQPTYAAMAQSQMGMAMGPNGMIDMASMRPEQRDVIDRWRQSVMP